ncbi:oxoprolinase subunit A [Ruminococcaceae bacterium BL-6]|nr:oxoprolinase subunit A [Ruminococcaceae bacterium BL-6]
MNRIDLNCDLGESFGAYKIGRDEEVVKYISSANVGCGFHAGDPCVMEHTVRLAKQNGVSVGAHPGFPDLLGFGRRKMDVKPEEAKAYMKYQIGALNAFCVSNGVKLVHVKPHGALYNMAGKDEKLAGALAEAVYEVDPGLIFLGLSGSKMLEAARAVGLTCASEVFADRAYNADGSLVARGTPGAVIHDVNECVRRIIGMVKDHTVTAITGEQIHLEPQSICVHGDTAEAVEFVRNIRESLTGEGIEIANLAAVCAGK